MRDDDDEARKSELRARRGLRRLMLRLPSSREKLRALKEPSTGLSSLAEAYEDASVMYFSLLRSGDAADPTLVREYGQICREIEDDVARYCAWQDTDASK